MYVSRDFIKIVDFRRKHPKPDTSFEKPRDIIYTFDEQQPCGPAECCTGKPDCKPVDHEDSHDTVYGAADGFDDSYITRLLLDRHQHHGANEQPREQHRCADDYRCYHALDMQGGKQRWTLLDPRLDVQMIHPGQLLLKRRLDLIRVAVVGKGKAYSRRFRIVKACKLLGLFNGNIDELTVVLDIAAFELAHHGKARGIPKSASHRRVNFNRRAYHQCTVFGMQSHHLSQLLSQDRAGVLRLRTVGQKEVRCLAMLQVTSEFADFGFAFHVRTADHGVHRVSVPARISLQKHEGVDVGGAVFNVLHVKRVRSRRLQSTPERACLECGW